MKRGGMNYPSVLRKAETLPSAKRETMSPKWRKVPDPSNSPIFVRGPTESDFCVKGVDLNHITNGNLRRKAIRLWRNRLFWKDKPVVLGSAKLENTTKLIVRETCRLPPVKVDTWTHKCNKCHGSIFPSPKCLPKSVVCSRLISTGYSLWISNIYVDGIFQKK